MKEKSTNTDVRTDARLMKWNGIDAISGLSDDTKERPMNWSGSDKKIARRLFDAALAAELADLLAAFKAKASNAVTPRDMWAVEEFLRQQRRDIDSKYDFRYSQLDLVLGRLLGTGRIGEEDIAEFSEDVRIAIARAAAFHKSRAG